MTLREELDELLVGYSIQGVENQGLHGWRCQYPDRYGPCTCYSDFLDALTTFVETRTEGLLNGYEGSIDPDLASASASDREDLPGVP